MIEDEIIRVNNFEENNQKIDVENKQLLYNDKNNNFSKKEISFPIKRTLCGKKCGSPKRQSRRKPKSIEKA